MTLYLRNRLCPCARCRVRGLTGAAFLITLGVLFLLDNYDIFNFDNTWPVLLIVIGVLIFAGRNASTEGHVQPFGIGGQGTPMASGQNDPMPGAGPEVKS